MRVTVVGAGIAGLTAARALDGNHDVVVLDRGRSVGGRLATRRMGDAVDHRVLKLHRSRYAGIGVQKLAPGRWRPLTRAEWRKLGTMVGLDR